MNQWILNRVLVGLGFSPVGSLTKWSCELQLRHPSRLKFSFPAARCIQENQRYLPAYVLEALQRATLHDLCLTSVQMFVLLQVTIDLSIADRCLFFQCSASIFNWSRTLLTFAQTEERQARVCREQQWRGRRGFLESRNLKQKLDVGCRLPPHSSHSRSLICCVC